MISGPWAFTVLTASGIPTQITGQEKRLLSGFII